MKWFLLERFSQEEALLDVIVGGVGGVDVFNTGESSAYSAVFIYSLQKMSTKSEVSKSGGGGGD